MKDKNTIRLFMLIFNLGYLKFSLSSELILIVVEFKYFIYSYYSIYKLQ